MCAVKVHACRQRDFRRRHSPEHIADAKRRGRGERLPRRAFPEERRQLEQDRHHRTGAEDVGPARGPERGRRAIRPVRRAAELPDRMQEPGERGKHRLG